MALIKCQECGKEISSEAKACPNCGSPNEIVTQKNNLIKKIVYDIIGCIILVSVFFMVIYVIKINRKSYIYGHEAIEILEKLKNSEITVDTASYQLEKIYKLVNEEYSKLDSDSNESSRLFIIELAISGAVKTDRQNNVSIPDINEAISDIKEQMSFFS